MTILCSSLNKTVVEEERNRMNQFQSIGLLRYYKYFAHIIFYFFVQKLFPFLQNPKTKSVLLLITNVMLQAVVITLQFSILNIASV